MRSEQTFRLGRVTIDGDLIAFEREAEHLRFEADRRDTINIGVQYQYREASDERERTVIRLTAHLDGQKPETFETVIGDNPLMDDSRRGFLSVPVRVAGRGEIGGSYLIETSYESGEWRAKDPSFKVEERAEGRFTLLIK